MAQQFGFKQSITSSCTTHFPLSRNRILLLVSEGITLLCFKCCFILNPDTIQLCWNIINTRKQAECDRALSFLVLQTVILGGSAPSLENNRNVNWTETQKGMYLPNKQRVWVSVALHMRIQELK